jgi:hypothetical protein
MTYENERLRILEMIDNGLISASEGIKLLDALQGEDEAASVSNPAAPVAQLSASQPEVEARLQGASQVEPAIIVEDLPENEAPAAHPEINESIDKWRKWWWVPMWVGIAVTVSSGILMFLAWQAGGYSFWFACSWFPFLLGVAVMALAWSSRTARWLHLRVHQPSGEWPQKIAISIPLPLRLTAWFFRTFGRHIPNMQNTSIDEIIMALEHTSNQAPFYVEVDEGERGERVEIFIG